MRTFVQLRRMIDSNRELSRKISALERKYDGQLATVFTAIKELICVLRAQRRLMGGLAGVECSLIHTAKEQDRPVRRSHARGA